jgi:hypothetical protein
MAERLRWKLWGFACRLPRVCPAAAVGAVVWRTRPLREMAVDDACLRDCAPGELCWCGKLRREPPV